jgi:hypothetical protein
MSISIDNVFSSIGFIAAAGMITHLFIMFVEYMLSLIIGFLGIFSEGVLQLIPVIAGLLININAYFTLIIESLIIVSVMWSHIKNQNLYSYRNIILFWPYHLLKLYYKIFQYACLYVQYIVLGIQKDSDKIVKTINESHV